MTADFRSDTFTAPHAAMRKAMAEAVVGDDVWGEDPTVRELEEEGAAFLGKEASLFVPSGTMGNQVAVHVHCRAGDELICEERSHVYWYEGGAVARLSGTQVRTLTAPRGFPTPEQVIAAVRGDDPHYPRSRLLVIEDTHNMAGGRVAGPDEVRALADAACGAGLRVHVDGARLVNAAVASGCEARELAGPADSVSLCLSKGLGAPVGSLLAGSREFVAAARRARKAFGGAMRQAGILAAAGLIALREGPELIAMDHRRARRLGEALAAHPSLRVDTDTVESNIVMVDLEAGEPEDLLAHSREAGVLAAAVGPRRIRLVTHRDVHDDDVERCIAAFTSWTPRA